MQSFYGSIGECNFFCMRARVLKKHKSSSYRGTRWPTDMKTGMLVGIIGIEKMVQ